MTRARSLAVALVASVSLAVSAAPAGAKTTLVACSINPETDVGILTYEKSNGDTKTKETTVAKAQEEWAKSQPGPETRACDGPGK